MSNFLNAPSVFSRLIRRVTFLLSIIFDISGVFLLISFLSYISGFEFIFLIENFVFEKTAMISFILVIPLIILAPIDLLRYKPRSKIILGVPILGSLIGIITFLILVHLGFNPPL